MSVGPKAQVRALLIWPLRLESSSLRICEMVPSDGYSAGLLPDTWGNANSGEMQFNAEVPLREM